MAPTDVRGYEVTRRRQESALRKNPRCVRYVTPDNEQVSVLTIDTSGARWQGLAMSRKLRIEYPGARYHIMSRGDQREDIFRDDEDRQGFLSTLGEACGKTEWQVPIA